VVPVHGCLRAAGLQQIMSSIAGAAIYAQRMLICSHCIGAAEAGQCRQPIYRERAMLEIGHFIGGKRVAGASGRSQDVMQPMDGTVRAKVALTSAAEVRQAVENAKSAQPGWA